jgi:hypothetical protein
VAGRAGSGTAVVAKYTSLPEPTNCSGHEPRVCPADVVSGSVPAAVTSLTQGKSTPAAGGAGSESGRALKKQRAPKQTGRGAHRVTPNRTSADDGAAVVG